jgi:Ca-activated chloride channel family protein
MEFLWPSMLLSLPLVPLFILIYIWTQRKGQVISPGGLSTSQGETQQRLGNRRHIPAALLLFGLLMLLLALARPKSSVSLPRSEGIVILAFDVSRSMAASDMQPSRMEVAKSAAKEFVIIQPPGVLIGVVAFSDSGFSVQAPTSDQDGIIAAIDRLSPELGTSLANGIFASLSIIIGPEESAPSLYTDLDPVPTPEPTPVPEGYFAPAAIVLLTDGENNEQPEPLFAAQTAAERGVRIYTIGLGSPLGTTIELEGYKVHTKLKQRILEDIARLTDGAYYNASTAGDLHSSGSELSRLNGRGSSFASVVQPLPVMV